MSELATRLAGQQRSVRAQRPAAVRQHQLRHRARRLHAARSRQLQREAQRGERRGQPRRREQQPELELRRRGPDRRPGDRRAARAAEAQLPGDAAALAGRADDQPRRRARAHAAGQQQRLLPGQRAHAGSTGTSRDEQSALLEFTTKLVHFRLSQPALRRRKYFQGRSIRGGGVKDVAWLAPDGREMNDEAWNADFVRSLGMLLSGNAIERWTSAASRSSATRCSCCSTRTPTRCRSRCRRSTPTSSGSACSTRSTRTRAERVVQRPAAATRCRAGRSPCSRSTPPLRERRRAGASDEHAAAVTEPVGVEDQSRRPRVASRQSAVVSRQSCSRSVDSRRAATSTIAGHRPPTTRRDASSSSASSPTIDGGRFPIKRTRRRDASTSPPTSSPTATMSIVAVLRDRHVRSRSAPSRGADRCPRLASPRRLAWRETPMTLVAPGTDEWTARFDVDAVGWHEYQIVAWVDRFLTWRRDVRVKVGGRPGRRAGAARGRAAGSRGGRARRTDRRRPRRRRAGCSTRADALSRLRRRSRTASTSALDRRARRADGASTPIGRARPTSDGAVASGSIASGRASARGTRCFRARPDPTRRAAARSARRPRGCPRIADLGFDVVYLPPIHPIGTSFRKGRNNALVAGARRSRAARGRSDRPAGGHTAVEPGARHARRLRRVSRRGRAARSRGRARSRVAVLAGSPVGPRASRMVPPSARRHDQVRRESAEEVSGHLPVRLRVRRLARAVAGAARRHAVLDRSRRAHLPRRQPAHEDVRLLGVADRPGARARTRTCIFLAEAFTRPHADALPRQGRLHAVVHLLHLAEHQGGADRVLHRADDDRGRASTCGRTCSRTRPTSCTRTCSSGGRPAFEARLLLAATLGANYGIYSGFELCEGRAIARHARSTRIPRSTSIRKWDWDRPRPHRGAGLPRQPRSGTAHRALQFDDTLRFHDDRQPGDHRLQQDARRTASRAAAHDRQPRSASHAARARPGAARALGVGGDSLHRRAICSTTPTYTWRGEWNYVRFDPDIRQGHILWLPKRRT